MIVHIDCLILLGNVYRSVWRIYWWILRNEVLSYEFHTKIVSGFSQHQRAYKIIRKSDLILAAGREVSCLNIEKRKRNMYAKYHNLTEAVFGCSLTRIYFGEKNDAVYFSER